MNIEFNCSNCQAGLKVLKSFAGRVVQCPKCGKRTKVPGIEGDAAPAMAPSLYGRPVAKKLAVTQGRAEEKPVAGKGTPEARTGGAAPGAPEAAGEPAAPVPEAGEAAGPAPEKAVSAGPAPAMPAAEKAPVAVEPAPSSAASAGPVRDKSAQAPAKAAPEPAGREAVGGAGAVASAAALPAVDRTAEVARLEAALREAETRLEVATLKTEEAERARAKAEEERQRERSAIEEKAAAHFRAELDAAKRSISELERKVEFEYRRRIAAEVAAQARTPAEIERDLLKGGVRDPGEDTVAPEALLAGIRETAFGRRLRMAPILHVVGILLLSAGYLYHKVRDRGEADESSSALREEPAPAAAAVEEPAEPVTAPAAAPAPVRDAPPVEAPVERAGTSALERTIESLPEPDEKPVPSAVSLGL